MSEPINAVWLKEAERRAKLSERESVTEMGRSITIISHYLELQRDNWTPPDPISPRVRAAREWAKTHWANEGSRKASEVDFLAGFAAAVEKAAVLRSVIRKTAGMFSTSAAVTSELLAADETYRQSIGEE